MSTVAPSPIERVLIIPAHPTECYARLLRNPCYALSLARSKKGRKTGDKVYTGWYQRVCLSVCPAKGQMGRPIRVGLYLLVIILSWIAGFNDMSDPSGVENFLRFIDDEEEVPTDHCI